MLEELRAKIASDMKQAVIIHIESFMQNKLSRKDVETNITNILTIFTITMREINKAQERLNNDL